MTKKQIKEMIKEKQIEVALEGNVEMLKWLGLNLLGQDRRPNMDECEDNILPSGFNVSRIPNIYEKAVADEYEENREEFLKWKQEFSD
tara:strand:- start:2027 stop:2290 length:264 start_codon:yes stop_codon:yes gene_type:complete